MENMHIYNLCREVPREAQKPIAAGRLKGMTDINPMWRIAKLTELFGPCGIGWKYYITRCEMVPGANDEVACFVDVDLFYKWEGQWSEAVVGTGGATFVAKERNGLYTSDECYKMALTDALSVACKALGVGANIYWAGGRSKYTAATEPDNPPAPEEPARYICSHCDKEITTVINKGTRYSPEEIVVNAIGTYGRSLCWDCMKKAQRELAEEQTRKDMLAELEMTADEVTG